MGQYIEAARDAMEMARFEQEEGNYRVAHDKLFATVQQLDSMGKAVPTELTRMLSLLHRYSLNPTPFLMSFLKPNACLYNA